MSLTDVINPENTKKVIKLQDVLDAFRVVYEGVTTFHLRPEQSNGNVNKLLDKLIEFDEAEQIARTAKHQESVPTSLKVIEPENKLAGFVVE